MKPRWLLARAHVDNGLVELGEASLEGRCLAVETMLRKPFINREGYLDISTGLGIELDEKKLVAQRFDGVWDNPRFTAEDGGFSEW